MALGLVPLRAYSVTENSTKNAPKHFIFRHPTPHVPHRPPHVEVLATMLGPAII